MGIRALGDLGEANLAFVGDEDSSGGGVGEANPIYAGVGQAAVAEVVGVPVEEAEPAGVTEVGRAPPRRSARERRPPRAFVVRPDLRTYDSP